MENKIGKYYFLPKKISQKNKQNKWHGCSSWRPEPTDHTGMWEVLCLRLGLTVSLKDSCICTLRGSVDNWWDLQRGLMDIGAPAIIPFRCAGADRRVTQINPVLVTVFQLPKCKHNKPLLLISLKFMILT